MQRRWWWDVDAKRKTFDKPAISKSKYVFVRSHVPVVMLKNTLGVGKKGQIVHVKRGYARHHLVPKGQAVFGTWEHIDAYADPALVDDPTLKGRVAAERKRLPFDWIGNIHLSFIRWVRADHNSLLLEPVTTWDVLQELSSQHQLDLLPANLDLPKNGITSIGVHEVPVRIQFRSPETAAGRYTFLIEVVSQQSQEDELRREEMARAVAESIRFQLPQKGGAIDAEEGFEEGGDEPAPINTM